AGWPLACVVWRARSRPCSRGIRRRVHLPAARGSRSEAFHSNAAATARGGAGGFSRVGEERGPSPLLKLCCALLPGFSRDTRRKFRHLNASVYRTHQPAQVASHTLLFIDARDAVKRRLRRALVYTRGRGDSDLAAALGFGLRRSLVPGAVCAQAVEMDARVRAIPASGIAELTADAGPWIDPRHQLVIQIQMAPIGETRQASAAEIVQSGESFVVHPIAEPVDHVLDDPVPIM